MMNHKRIRYRRRCPLQELCASLTTFIWYQNRGFESYENRGAIYSVLKLLQLLRRSGLDHGSSRKVCESSPLQLSHHHVLEAPADRH